MPVLTRRRALIAGALAASIVRPRRSFAANPGGVRVGAIRFDSWYGPDTMPGSSGWIDAHLLDAPAYQGRAPWFATRLSPAFMSINGVQANMDAECVYAFNAGIKWWAFFWGVTPSTYQTAWTYYQASPNKALVNSTIIIGYNSLTQAFPPQATLVSMMGQSNWEKYGSRPLLCLLHDGSSLAACAAAVTSLRSACATAGIGNPYVVLMGAAAGDLAAIGADVLSAYAYGGPTIAAGPMAYTALDTSVQTYNATLIASGSPVIPIGMTGWDRRPRFERPPSFDPEYRPYAAMSGYVTPGTPAQQASHVASVIAQVTANPTACPANRAILYSWDECGEGGGCLIPTWTAGGPNTATLTAVSGVTQ
jgi:hypothetical protein